MGESEIPAIPQGEGRVVYRLTIPNGSGTLEVHPPDSEGYWTLFDITVSPEGKGLGKRLIQRFCEDHGSGTLVQGPIGHEPSLRYVLKTSLFKQMDRGTKLEIEHTGFIKEIPIVKFLEHSGVKVDRIHLAKTEDEVAFAILYYFGRVK